MEPLPHQRRRPEATRQPVWMNCSCWRPATRCVGAASHLPLEFEYIATALFDQRYVVHSNDMLEAACELAVLLEIDRCDI